LSESIELTDKESIFVTLPCEFFLQVSFAGRLHH
jgi:hypothetical protein